MVYNKNYFFFQKLKVMTLKELLKILAKSKRILNFKLKKVFLHVLLMRYDNKKN